MFVGTGMFPQLAPGEDFELGFGADERVKVRRVVTEDKKGETGTFTTSRVEERRYAIMIKNLHTRAIQLQLVDRTPVAMHQDIKVEFTMDKGPQPTEKDVNDRRGTMLWEMKAEPGRGKDAQLRLQGDGARRQVDRLPGVHRRAGPGQPDHGQVGRHPDPASTPSNRNRARRLGRALAAPAPWLLIGQGSVFAECFLKIESVASRTMREKVAQSTLEH